MNVEVTRNEIIIKDNSEQTHENEYNITTCYFAFDEFTNSFQNKYAVFTIISTDEVYQQDIINNQCEIPAEVLKYEYETVKLGVFGENIDNSGTEAILENRFSPSYATFIVNTGSYKEGATTPEIITPSQYEIYSQALQEGLQEVDDKLDEVVETVDGKIEEVDTKLGEVDTKLEVVDGKIEDVDNAIERTDEAIDRTNNLNLDVSDKVDGDVTVTLTKKDASTKTVVLSDGTSLEFNWNGTKLGIKTSDEEEYTYVDLQGIQGPAGPQGEAFRIKKTYSSVAEMNADFNNMEYGDYVMIASSVEVEDNAKLYTRGENQWIFITDFSGATGIRGPVGATPNIQIGSVTSGSAPSVTRTGTDENPVLNFVLQKGDKGNTGNTGPTGNGISSIEKTSTSGLVDTYTITYTNGNTTTFDVSNGNGIDRIEKTATVGNKDTYTIYFTNGSTTTYEVSNGEVTREELEEEVERLSMIYNAFPTTTGEVEEGSINGTAEVPFKEIGLKGNTSQESTTGKNLVPNNLASGSSSGITYTVNSDGSIKLSGTATARVEPYLYVDNNNPITFKAGTYRNTSSKMMILYADGYILAPPNQTFTLDEDKNVINIYFRIENGETVNETYYPQIILNSITDTSYEPYTNGPAPNPDYPYPVNVVTGDNEVKVEGKNLFDINNTQKDKWLDRYGVLKDIDIAITSEYIEIDNNASYTLSGINTYTSTNYYTLNQYDSSKQWIKGKEFSVTTNTNINRTFISGTQPEYIDSNCKYIKLSFYKYTDYISNIQLEKGSQATLYLPYVSQTYPINLGSMELCKIGDYQDYIAKSTGKNLFDISKLNSTNLTNAIIGSNTITLTGTNDYHSTVTGTNLGDIADLEIGKTYTLTFDTTYTGNNKNKIFLRGSQSYWESGTSLTITQEMLNDKFAFYGTNNAVVSNIMIRLSNISDTSYEPYGKVWYKYGAIGKTKIGDLSWSYSSTNQYFLSEISNIFIESENGVLFKGLCDIYLPTTSAGNNSWANKTNYSIGVRPSSNYLCIKDTNYSNKDTFKEARKDNLTYYVLATPTTTEITDTTLIEQLDNLEKAYSYDTQTNISQTNQDKPFIISYEAILSLKNVLDS